MSLYASLYCIYSETIILRRPKPGLLAIADNIFYYICCIKYTNMRTITPIFLALLTFAFVSCDDKEDTPPKKKEYEKVFTYQVSFSDEDKQQNEGNNEYSKWIRIQEEKITIEERSAISTADSASVKINNERLSFVRNPTAAVVYIRNDHFYFTITTFKKTIDDHAYVDFIWSEMYDAVKWNAGIRVNEYLGRDTTGEKYNITVEWYKLKD